MFEEIEEEKRRTREKNALLPIVQNFIEESKCRPAIEGKKYNITISELTDEMIGRTSREELLEDPSNLQVRFIYAINKFCNIHGISDRKKPISCCIVKKNSSGSQKIYLVFRWNFDEVELEKRYTSLSKKFYVRKNIVDESDVGESSTE